MNEIPKLTFKDRLLNMRRIMHQYVWIPLLLLCFFLYIFATTGQQSLTNLCRTTCMDVLESNNWNTGQLGLECYCIGAKNITNLENNCNTLGIKPFYNETLAKSTG